MLQFHAGMVAAAEWLGNQDAGMRPLLRLLLALAGPVPAAPNDGSQADAQASAAVLNALRAQPRPRYAGRRDHIEHVGEIGLACVTGPGISSATGCCSWPLP